MIQTVKVNPNPDDPGNGYKVTLPDGSMLYFTTREKAQKFADGYNKDISKLKLKKTPVARGSSYTS